MYRWWAPRPEDIANGAVTDPEIVTTDVEHVCMLPLPTTHKGGHVCSCSAVAP